MVPGGSHTAVYVSLLPWNLAICFWVLKRLQSAPFCLLTSLVSLFVGNLHDFFSCEDLSAHASIDELQHSQLDFFDEEQAPAQRTWHCASWKGHLRPAACWYIFLGECHWAEITPNVLSTFRSVPEEHEILLPCQPVMNSCHDLPLVSGIKGMGEKKILNLNLLYDQQRAKLLVSIGNMVIQFPTYLSILKKIDFHVWANYNCKNGCLCESQSHFPACDHILYSASNSQDIDIMQQVAFPWAFLLIFFIAPSIFQKIASLNRDQIHLSFFVCDC